MKCSEVGLGTYACTYNAALPWTHYKERLTIVEIDKCLFDEIRDLWELGIRTTASCCGHAKAPAVIAVRKEDVERMKELGYINLKDTQGVYGAFGDTLFIPKTKLPYQ